jgi:hypothetical protein
MRKSLHLCPSKESPKSITELSSGLVIAAQIDQGASAVEDWWPGARRLTGAKKTSASGGACRLPGITQCFGTRWRTWTGANNWFVPRLRRGHSRDAVGISGWCCPPTGSILRILLTLWLVQCLIGRRSWCQLSQCLTDNITISARQNIHSVVAFSSLPMHAGGMNISATQPHGFLRSLVAQTYCHPFVYKIHIGAAEHTVANARR